MTRWVAQALLPLLSLPLVCDQAWALPEEPGSPQVGEAVRQATLYLRRAQSKEGWWMGDCTTDASATAEYVALTHYLGRVDRRREAKAVRYILSRQNRDGGWSAYPGGPGVLDLTVVSYLGLKLAGVAPGHPALVRARGFVLGQGGAQRADRLTRSLLALFGQVPWTQLTPLTTDIVQAGTLLERIGLVRVVLIPYAVLSENAHVASPDEGHGVQELFVGDPWNGQPPAPAQPRKGECHEMALQWILERQESDGTWGGLFYKTMACLMALGSTGDPAFDAAIERGLRGLEAMQSESPRSLEQRFAQSPVWDTAGTLRALYLAGVPATDPALRKAVDRLPSAQASRPGDWALGSPEAEPGAWGFGFVSQWYPDTDDTAVVLAALAPWKTDGGPRVSESVDRGLAWLLSLQNDDGGWASFGRNCLDPARLLPSVDTRGLADLSCEEVTARVLTALHALGSQDCETVISRAQRFLLAKQTPQGQWFGRWGVAYVWGTSQVVNGLIASGLEPSDPAIVKAITWLRSVQNADGGWGETPAAHDDPSLAGKGESTATQTAAVVMALVAAGEIRSPEVSRGLRYLLRRQRRDGSWHDPQFLGTGIPGRWYTHYGLFPTYVSLAALATYRTAL